MKHQEFFSDFNKIKADIQDLKTLQQRVLLFLENNQLITTERFSSSEERISVKETCKILGCSEVTLWKLRNEGTIPFTRIKRTIRFKKIDVLNYLNQKG